MSTTRTVYLTQTTKWGSSRTWRLRFDHFPSLDDETAALCRAIADSDEFAEQYIGMVMNGGSDLYGIIRDREEGQGEWSKIPEDEFIANSPTYRAIEAELREQISFDFFQQRIVGYVGVVMENERGRRYWMDLPIYESQPALLAASGSELTPEHVIEEEIATREMTLVGVHRDPATGDLLDSVVLEGEAAAELYRANFNCVNWRDAFFLTRLDRNYIFQSTGNFVPCHHFYTIRIFKSCIWRFIWRITSNQGMATKLYFSFFIYSVSRTWAVIFPFAGTISISVPFFTSEASFTMFPLSFAILE